MTIADLPLEPSFDGCTQANYHEVKSSHLELDWTVDWVKRIISGSVTHHFVSFKDGLTSIHLDTSYLHISSVEADGAALEFVLGERHPNLGSKLSITLSSALAKGDKVTVKIAYSTTTECTAAGWLEAHQTASGNFPFLFTQCQAIHCRSLIPVQDTPAIKASYDAKVTSTLPVLMSALRLTPPAEEEIVIDGATAKEYTFTQRVPIASYLIALAGGELAFKAIGERTGVWAEKGQTLESAHWEFKRDTDDFLKVAESLTSPYEWGRYDMLLLPSSFPYGGMEHPTMTFLTPALVVGDRSETDVICHEQSHSWFGNLIGCDSWTSFWLNEGWTTYCERLVQRELHGEAARGFEFLVGNQALLEDLKKQASHPPFQRLVIPYNFGDDPDDGFSSVPYDKGSQFLLHLEQTVGGLDQFKPYIKSYVKRFSGLSISTQDWLNHFWAYWKQFPETEAKLRSEVDWDGWLNGEGSALPVKLEVDTTLADVAEALALKWDGARAGTDYAAFSAKDTDGWRSNQFSYFLVSLRTNYEPLPAAAVEALAKAYKTDESKNPEILFRWYLLAMKSEGQLRAREAAQWLRHSRVGRMKYVRPIYRAIAKVDKDLAVETYEAVGRRGLHPIAARIVAKDLDLKWD